MWSGLDVAYSVWRRLSAVVSFVHERSIAPAEDGAYGAARAAGAGDHADPGARAEGGPQGDVGQRTFSRAVHPEIGQVGAALRHGSSLTAEPGHARVVGIGMAEQHLDLRLA